MEPINLFEYEERALQRLPRLARDYYRSGAQDELTLGRNRQAFTELALLYRVLVDVSTRDASTTVLGQSIASPIIAAPTAFHRLATPDGESATARGVRDAGTAMVLSTLSNVPIEEVVAQNPALFFQLYVYKDRGLTRDLVHRVEAAGAKALFLTVDAPLLGTRERDERNQFQLDPDLELANVVAEARKLPQGAGSGLARYFSSLLDPSLTWADVEWLRSISSLPVVVKGVVRADDAARAVEHGAAGVVVSNHGGRQLDTSIATIEALPAIAAAVDGRAEILLDGGVRRGTDVLKALALGARAVMLGRPILWGLAVDGAAGVTAVLQLLMAEFDQSMALSGCPDLASITPDLVRR